VWGLSSGAADSCSRTRTSEGSKRGTLLERGVSAFLEAKGLVSEQIFIRFLPGDEAMSRIPCEEGFDDGRRSAI